MPAIPGTTDITENTPKPLIPLPSLRSFDSVAQWFHTEWTGSQSTMVKYYTAGGRLAMRTGTGTGTTNLTYLFGDHLNSTSFTYRADTNATVTQLYKPWGESKYSSGTLPTKYTYTRQYSYTADFGLMFYNAR